MQAFLVFHFAAFESQYLSGIVVDLVLGFFYFFFGHFGEVRAFGMLTANHAVHIFVAAALPR